MTRKLTGRTRYRVVTRLWRMPLVILQVEERVTFVPPLPYPPYYEWRDATAEDVATFKLRLEHENETVS